MLCTSYFVLIYISTSFIFCPYLYFVLIYICPNLYLSSPFCLHLYFVLTYICPHLYLSSLIVCPLLYSVLTYTLSSFIFVLLNILSSLIFCSHFQKLVYNASTKLSRGFL